MTTIKTGNGEFQVASVKVDLMIEWICSKCKYQNFLVGYMTPSIMNIRCKKCGNLEKVDTRLKF